MTEATEAVREEGSAGDSAVAGGRAVPSSDHGDDTGTERTSRPERSSEAQRDRAAAAEPAAVFSTATHLSYAKFANMFADARAMLKIVHEAAPGALRWIAVSALVEALVATAWPFATKMFFDCLPEAIAKGSAKMPVVWLSADMGLAMIRTAAGHAFTHGARLIETAASPHLTGRLLAKGARVEYGLFESPAFLDRLARARQDVGAHGVPYAMQALAILRSTLTFMGCLLLLTLMAPIWTVPIAVVACLPTFVANLARARRSFEIDRKNAQRDRQAWYVEWLMTSADASKEVRAYGLANWLGALYARLHAPFRDSQTVLSKQHFSRSARLVLLSDLVIYVPFLYVTVAAVHGRMSLGHLLFFVFAFHQFAAALRQMLGAFSVAFEQHLYVRNILDVLDTPEAERNEEPDARNVLPKAPDFVIEDLWFRYPGTARDVLAGLDLRVGAGETLAIVGRNGIGKTTLVKLLLGLYPYERGKIALAGIDLATKPVGWRRDNFGVVLQDFNRYQFSMRENVAAGWVPDAADPERVAEAIRHADADDLLAELPQGVETMLGPAFGGRDISGGQWQRLVIARLLMRQSRVWIMDEPTAAMDPESEERIIASFRQLTKGRTAIIITHRFATARLADRIAVIDEGRVTEIGTHDELLAAKGQYARIFQMQAKGYSLPRSEQS